MKSKILYIGFVTLALTYVSCSKISESLQQDTIVTDTVSFDIPVITDIPNPVTISNIESRLNFDEQLIGQTQNMSLANLTAVKLKSLNLNLISTAAEVDTANNFGKLQSVRIRIADEGKTDSLANASIASAATSSALELTPVILPETLRPYVSGSGVRYHVMVRAKRLTTKIMRVRIEAAYTFTLSR